MKRFADVMYKLYSEDAGKQLVHTGALGWLFSSLAQVWVVATDKNIDQKEKKFLVPQEICDGATNVTLYYTISQLIKKGGDMLVDKGHFISDEVVKGVEILSNDKSSFENGLKTIGKSLSSNATLKNEFAAKPVSTLMENFKTLNVFNNLSPAKKEAVTKAFESALGFKNGVSVITAIGASILACNVITPVVRNKMAGLYQQKFILSQEKDTKPQVTQTQFATPLPRTFQPFNVSGGLKI